MIALSNTDSHFHFLPVLSQSSEEWKGLKGRVHPVYTGIAQNNPGTIFYICGWTEMVRETKNNLKAMGFSRKQVKFELYD